MQFPPDKAHESESGFPDRYDPDDQYAVPTRPGSQVGQTESGQRQTGSYDLPNQFPSRVKSARHTNLQQNKLRPGHVLISSCLHGTWRYEYRHVSAVHFPALQPLARYAQSVRLFCVLNRYANAPSATSRVDRLPSMRHRAAPLQATSVHATCHLSTSFLVLAMVPADSHDPGNLEWLHVYYGTGYDLYHDGLKVREWHGNAVQADLQSDDLTRLQSQLNARLLAACLTSALLQF